MSASLSRDLVLIALFGWAASLLPASASGGSCVDPVSPNLTHPSCAEVARRICSRFRPLTRNEIADRDSTLFYELKARIFDKHPSNKIKGDQCVAAELDAHLSNFNFFIEQAEKQKLSLDFPPGNLAALWLETLLPFRRDSQQEKKGRILSIIYTHDRDGLEWSESLAQAKAIAARLRAKSFDPTRATPVEKELFDALFLKNPDLDEFLKIERTKFDRLLSKHSLSSYLGNATTITCLPEVCAAFILFIRDRPALAQELEKELIKELLEFKHQARSIRSYRQIVAATDGTILQVLKSDLVDKCESNLGVGSLIGPMETELEGHPQFRVAYQHLGEEFASAQGDYLRFIDAKWTPTVFKETSVEAIALFMNLNPLSAEGERDLSADIKRVKLVGIEDFGKESPAPDLFTFFSGASGLFIPNFEGGPSKIVIGMTSTVRYDQPRSKLLRAYVVRHELGHAFLNVPQGTEIFESLTTCNSQGAEDRADLMASVVLEQLDDSFYSAEQIQGLSEHICSENASEKGHSGSYDRLDKLIEGNSKLIEALNCRAERSCRISAPSMP